MKIDTELPFKNEGPIERLHQFLNSASLGALAPDLSYDEALISIGSPSSEEMSYSFKLLYYDGFELYFEGETLVGYKLKFDDTPYNVSLNNLIVDWFEIVRSWTLVSWKDFLTKNKVNCRAYSVQNERDDEVIFYFSQSNLYLYFAHERLNTARWHPRMNADIFFSVAEAQSLWVT